jgi:hypothetical protein
VEIRVGRFAGEDAPEIHRLLRRCRGILPQVHGPSNLQIGLPFTSQKLQSVALLLLPPLIACPTTFASGEK